MNFFIIYDTTETNVYVNLVPTVGHEINFLTFQPYLA